MTTGLPILGDVNVKKGSDSSTGLGKRIARRAAGKATGPSAEFGRGGRT